MDNKEYQEFLKKFGPTDEIEKMFPSTDFWRKLYSKREAELSDDFHFEKIVYNKRYSTKNAMIVADREEYYSGLKGFRLKEYLFRTLKGNYFVYIKSSLELENYKDIEPISLETAVSLYYGSFSNHWMSFKSAFPGVNIEDA